MKAIIWIPENTGVQPIAQLLDRPWIQHLVEQLIDRGIREIRFITAGEAMTGAVRRHLGNGQRWGIYVQVATGAEVLPESAGHVLFGRAGTISQLPSFAETGAGRWNTLYFDQVEGVGHWSGWALLQSGLVSGFLAQLQAGADWRCAVRELGVDIKKVFLDGPVLPANSPADVLRSNRLALDGACPGLYFTGREAQPGVWIARGARVDASAKLEAPCYIGEDAWIGAGAHLGPHAVIGANSVVEAGTSVVRSVVAEGTFLGPELDIRDSYVFHNQIHNTRLGVVLEIEEEHVASALRPAKRPGLLQRIGLRLRAA